MNAKYHKQLDGDFVEYCWHQYLVEVKLNPLWILVWLRGTNPHRLSVATKGITDWLIETVDSGPCRRGPFGSSPDAVCEALMTSQMIHPRRCNFSSEMTGHRLTHVYGHTKPLWPPPVWTLLLVHTLNQYSWHIWVASSGVASWRLHRHTIFLRQSVEGSSAIELLQEVDTSSVRPSLPYFCSGGGPAAQPSLSCLRSRAHWHGGTGAGVLHGLAQLESDAPREGLRPVTSTHSAEDARTGRTIGSEDDRFIEGQTDGQVTWKTSTEGLTFPSALHPAHGGEAHRPSGQCQSTDHSSNILRASIICLAVCSLLERLIERHVLQLPSHLIDIHVSTKKHHLFCSLLQLRVEPELFP